MKTKGAALLTLCSWLQEAGGVLPTRNDGYRALDKMVSALHDRCGLLDALSCIFWMCVPGLLDALSCNPALVVCSIPPRLTASAVAASCMLLGGGTLPALRNLSKAHATKACPVCLWVMLRCATGTHSFCHLASSERPSTSRGQWSGSTLPPSMWQQV